METKSIHRALAGFSITCILLIPVSGFVLFGPTAAWMMLSCAISSSLITSAINGWSE